MMTHMYVINGSELVVDSDQLTPIRAALAQCQSYYEVEQSLYHGNVVIVKLHNLAVAQETVEARLHSILCEAPEDIIYQDAFLQCITSFLQWHEACECRDLS